MPGYPKDIVLEEDKLHKRHMCAICDLVLKKAVQSACGHRFCENCVKHQIENRSQDELRCPACGSHDSEDCILKKEQIYPDFHARKELKNVKVKCGNTSKGCQWRGTFHKYYEHEAECEFEAIKCQKAGCGKALMRANLAYHLEKDCPVRPIKCVHCGEEVVYKSFKKHTQTECPKIPIPCKDCGKKIPRENIPSHQDSKRGDCKKKKQMCPFAPLGCPFKVTASNGLNEHLHHEIAYHAELQIDKVETLTNQCESLLQTETILSTLRSRQDEEGKEDSACASPNQVPSLSSEHVNKLVAVFKQWFVLRGESEDGNAGNSTRVNQSSNTRRSVELRIKELQDKVKKSEEDLKNMRTLYAVVDKKNETFQEVVAVLNTQVEAVADKLGALERDNRHLQEVINQQERQIHAHDQMLTVKNVALAEQELRIQTLESASYNGILVWKITEFARRRREATSGKTTSFYSQPFYTSYHGYKMRARIYLNGDGMGKGTHLSLFFVVMKGRYDNVLHWPFKQKVTFMLVDQGNREHVVDAFRPDPTSSSFKKPTSEMNIASGCPLFVNLNQVQSNQYSYIKDDCLFVKVIVDVSDLERI